MILSDDTLRRMMAEKSIVVEPIEPYQVQPASIDLRLGRHFLKIDENTLESLSLDSEIPYVKIEKDEIIIPPHSFLLATTVELIRIPANVTAFVEGRSSIGRIGLFIQNAGWVDPGFEGNITLELFNANRLPLRLASGPAHLPDRVRLHGQGDTDAIRGQIPGPARHGGQQDIQGHRRHAQGLKNPRLARASFRAMIN